MWVLALSMAFNAMSPAWVERGHDRSAEVVAKAQKEAAIEVARINEEAAIRVAELNNEAKVVPNEPERGRPAGTSLHRARARGSPPCGPNNSCRASTTAHGHTDGAARAGGASTSGRGGGRQPGGQGPTQGQRHRPSHAVGATSVRPEHVRGDVPEEVRRSGGRQRRPLPPSWTPRSGSSGRRSPTSPRPW